MSKQMEKESEESGFLDGRDYTSEFLYEFFSLIVGNGVYANELAPTATNENMTITHGTGHAWINGVCYRNKIPFVLDIATSDGSLNRYDSLILRLNLSINEVYATIVQGDYAAIPTPPAVTRNADIFDLKICDIYIPAGCTKITQAQITDTRLDSSICGVPVFPVEHLDTTTFYRQIATDLDNLKKKEQAEILELLQQLNDLLEGDSVGNLIAEIKKKLPKDGTESMTADLNMANHKVTGLKSPEEKSDAASKDYVDTTIKSYTENNTLQGIESAEYPGCYYRTVNGVTEWYNPPMLPGVEYRTTRRYNNKPVYSKYVRYTYSGTLGAASGTARVMVPHDITGLDSQYSVEITGWFNEVSLPTMDKGGFAFIYGVGSGGIVLHFQDMTISDKTGHFLMQYTKE